MIPGKSVGFPLNTLISSTIAFILVMAATARITTGLELHMDIRFYDESYYLTQGRFWPISNWEADYSPLYSLYYNGLSLFEEDPFRLYYLNYRVWSLVFGMCAFGVLRSFGANQWLSWIWAVLAVCAELNLPLWPKAGHFAMLFISAGLIGFQWFRKSQFSFLCLSTLSLFILSWARPEFFLGGLVGVVLVLICCWKGGLPVGQNYICKASEQEQSETSGHSLNRILTPGLLIFGFIPILIFLSVWGLPIGRSGRGLVAFGQHFAHNWHQIQSKEGDVLFDWINWREVFAQVFGKADGLFSALFANPVAFAKHLWFNFKYLIYNSFILFSETLLCHRIVPFSTAVLVTAVVGLCEWSHGFNGLSKCYSKSIKFLKANGLYLLPLVISSLVAALFFQPRPHYILPLLPFFWAFSACLSREYSFPGLKSRFKFVIGSAVLASIFLFLPRPTAYFNVVEKREGSKSIKTREAIFEPFISNGLKGKQLVNNLGAIHFLNGKRVFDGSSGVFNYLGQCVNQKGKIGFEFDYPKLKPISDFLDREKIEVIYLAGSMKYDHFFEKDVFWEELKAKPESFGWRKLPIKQSKDSLLVRVN